MDPTVPADFREVLGHFASGVVIVAGVVDGVPHGMACQSFFSVSLDPPLVALCISHTSTSWRLISSSGSFCASILAEDQAALCSTFGSRGTDRFAATEWFRAPTGSPRVDGAIAWIDCDIENEYRSGDHVIVVGRIRAFDRSEGKPLIFGRGRFGTFHPTTRPAPTPSAQWDAEDVFGAGVWVKGVDW
ncbi:flavin reductase family protein [Okibacterium endophyticum]